MSLFDFGLDETLAAVRAGKPRELTAHERPVLDYLDRWHRGHQRPVSLARLGELTGLGERSVKGVINELRRTFLVPIGGLRGKDQSGLFLCVTEEDRNLGSAQYFRQALEEIRIAGIIRGSKLTMRELLGQLSLEVND